MAQITAVHVSAGDPVRRGQILLEIDPQAAGGQLAQARGGLAQARAQLALAERNFRRFEELAKTRAASELELDQARTQYEQTQGAVEQAEGAVTAAAAVAADSTVRAPFSGQVVRRLVEVGDLAAPGRPLLVLQTGGPRRLVLPVPESVVSRSDLRVGDEVPLEIGVRPDLGTVLGVVKEMTPGADPLSHSFRVEVGLPPSLDGNSARPLATGIAGRAWLPGGTRSAVTAPRDAILHRGGMSLVVVRAGDGTARTRVVTLGLSEGERVEVLSGLDGGETVLRGLATIPPSGAVVEEIRGAGEEASAASGDEPPQIETRPGEGGT
jgi:RND family efflux transporter MFP subunit